MYTFKSFSKSLSTRFISSLLGSVGFLDLAFLQTSHHFCAKPNLLTELCLLCF